MECHVCGAEGSKERLFEAVSKNGIIMICRKCANQGDYPVVRKPTTFQLKEAEKKESKGFYEKVKEERERMKQRNQQIIKKEKEDVSLREIVDRNYEAKVSSEKKPRADLVDNFHWLITRARRLKKISRGQLAKEISESEAAIKMAEQGILPEDDYRLVNKLESFLNIRIKKKDFEGKIERKEPARVLRIDSEVAKDLTIDDLKRMKKAREATEIEETKEEGELELEEDEKIEIEGLELEEENQEEKNKVLEKEKSVEFVDLDKGERQELSEEEIDKIIFGK